MSRVSLDTDDPRLRERLLSVVVECHVDEVGTGTTTDRLLGALAASPVPSEPPPGVYRDEHPDGSIWINDGESWNATGMLHPSSWLDIKHLAGSLTPLFSVDELIPDPTDQAQQLRVAQAMAKSAGHTWDDGPAGADCDYWTRLAYVALRAITEEEKP